MTKYLIVEAPDDFDPENQTIFDAMEMGAEWRIAESGEKMPHWRLYTCPKCGGIDLYVDAVVSCKLEQTSTVARAVIGQQTVTEFSNDSEMWCIDCQNPGSPEAFYNGD